MPKQSKIIYKVSGDSQGIQYTLQKRPKKIFYKFISGVDIDTIKSSFIVARISVNDPIDLSKEEGKQLYMKYIYNKSQKIIKEIADRIQTLWQYFFDEVEDEEASESRALKLCDTEFTNQIKKELYSIFKDNPQVSLEDTKFYLAHLNLLKIYGDEYYKRSFNVLNNRKYNLSDICIKIVDIIEDILFDIYYNPNSPEEQYTNYIPSYLYIHNKPQIAGTSHCHFILLNDEMSQGVTLEEVGGLAEDVDEYFVANVY